MRLYWVVLCIFSSLSALSVQEHYSALPEAFQEKRWETLRHHATSLVKEFAESSFSAEGTFYLGVAHFHLGDCDLANQWLTTYLSKKRALQHFREAMELKFQIAELFRKGTKKHIGGWAAMPRWFSAREEAGVIYDEVINAFPHDSLAALSLLGKGELQLQEEKFDEAITTYQTLIRRFPNLSVAGDAYLQVMRTYLLQSKVEYPDKTFLDLAELNVKKMVRDFPEDERIATIRELLGEMHEIYARHAYEIAAFYERTKKPHAARLYHAKIIKEYPSTHTAQLSKERLCELSSS